MTFSMNNGCLLQQHNYEKFTGVNVQKSNRDHHHKMFSVPSDFKIFIAAFLSPSVRIPLR